MSGIRRFKVAHLNEGYKALQDQDGVMVVVASRFFWTKSWALVDCLLAHPFNRFGSRHLSDSEKDDLVPNGDRPLPDTEPEWAKYKSYHSYKSVLAYMREKKAYWNGLKQARLPKGYMLTYTDGKVTAWDKEAKHMQNVTDGFVSRYDDGIVMVWQDGKNELAKEI